jgi:hypothetical protein
MLIIRPLAMDIRCGGVQSCATVTRVISVIPSAEPRRTGYPQTRVLEPSSEVAMHAKNATNMVKEKTVTHRTFFVIVQ